MASEEDPSVAVLSSPSAEGEDGESTRDAGGDDTGETNCTNHAREADRADNTGNVDNAADNADDTSTTGEANGVEVKTEETPTAPTAAPTHPTTRRSLQSLFGRRSSKKDTTNNQGAAHRADEEDGTTPSGSASKEGDSCGSVLLLFRQHVSKSEQAKQMFHLVEDDTLLDDFSCALLKTILLHGRLYVTNHLVGFHSNIFGKITTEVIPLAEVLRIDKARTAFVIPNAIEIRSSRKNFFFGSFLHRDKAYDLLVRLWEKELASIGKTREQVEEEYAAQKEIRSSKPDEKPRLLSAHKDGGMSFKDDEELKKQRGVVWSFVKQIGFNIMEGKRNVVNVSMPVDIFEPRSFLQRLTDEWAWCPIFLTKAARETPLERMKNIIAFVIAGLHLSCAQKKPFNPIIGETYQACLKDGTHIHLEQTSHHPPVSHWQIFGPNYCYHYHGHGEYAASFRGNSVKGYRRGPNIIEFPDGTSITWEAPPVWIRGVLWGDRIVEILQIVEFRDEKNGLGCDIHFDPEHANFLRSLFTRGKKAPSDTLRGSICRLETDAKGRQVLGEVLSRAEGSWIGWLEFDGQRYWDLTFDELIDYPAPEDNPLPSDSRFREDMHELAVTFASKGDLRSAQLAKGKLEDLQRADARLRKEGHKRKMKAKRTGSTVHLGMSHPGTRSLSWQSDGPPSSEF